MKDLFPLVLFLIRCFFFPGLCPGFVRLARQSHVFAVAVAPYAVIQDVDFALAQADGVA